MIEPHTRRPLQLNMGVRRRPGLRASPASYAHLFPAFMRIIGDFPRVRRASASVARRTVVLLAGMLFACAQSEGADRTETRPRPANVGPHYRYLEELMREQLRAADPVPFEQRQACERARLRRALGPGNVSSPVDSLRRWVWDSSGVQSVQRIATSVQGRTFTVQGAVCDSLDRDAAARQPLPAERW